MVDKDDILINEDGNRTFAMHKICIIDTAYNVIKEYEEPDIYVSDASVEDMRINLTRIVKSGDGYQGTSIDQLINKDEMWKQMELCLIQSLVITGSRNLH